MPHASEATIWGDIAGWLEDGSLTPVLAGLCATEAGQAAVTARVLSLFPALTPMEGPEAMTTTRAMIEDRITAAAEGLRTPGESVDQAIGRYLSTPEGSRAYAEAQRALATLVNRQAAEPVGPGAAERDVLDRVKEVARRFREADPTLTDEGATVRALDAEPQLYREYERARMRDRL